MRSTHELHAPKETVPLRDVSHIPINDTPQPQPRYIRATECKKVIHPFNSDETKIISCITQPSTITLAPGLYYAGDLYYASKLSARGAYRQFCDTICRPKNKRADILRVLYDNRDCVYIMLQSDGCATDESGHEYGIETASFTIMKLKENEHVPPVKADGWEIETLGSLFFPEVCGMEFYFEKEVSLHIEKNKMSVLYEAENNSFGVAGNEFFYIITMTDGLTKKIFNVPC